MLWLVVILLLFIFQVATILVLEFRQPSKAIAWMLILFIFPIIGFVLYYFLAKGYKNRRTIRRKGNRHMREVRRDLLRERKKSPDINRDPRLFGLLSNLPGSPATECNDVTILTNAAPTFEALLDAMAHAQDHIHLEFYTIRHDKIGTRFQEMMIRKAKEGVTVRLLYDGVGSIELSEKYVRTLREAGVETGCFLPPFIALVDKRLNYRNHRKIAVIDGKVGFLGGINIGDEYLGGNRKLGFWRDTHMKLKGDAVYFLQQTFLADWAFATGHAINGPRYYPEHDCDKQESVQIVNSGPDSSWDTILEVYFAAISTAKRRVHIATPYFIPDQSMLMALKTAAVSGVDVKIIIPSVADTHVVYWASLSYLDELLQAGVRFYKYKKGFIHAKVLITDQTLASVGTANMDMRSFYSNFEMNAFMFDNELIDRLEADFRRDLLDSEEITLAEFSKRGRLQRGKEVMARLLSPLL
ncbi:cardiolipin synthase [Paenibacillus cymbidii]|uniref:cardiolipin synthase n=1 Tax=Paenibacillus cymbidii TaxID=1639034 RepID=UPI001081E147|nr:cardiolipin synthase [Paenibacillus cymbidii]